MKSADKISDHGILEIVEHEGIVLGPYLDSQNIWTVYIGHTAAAGGPKPASMPKMDTRKFSREEVQRRLLEAVALFDVDLDKYEARVRDAVNVPLKRHQFDALTSFDFNTGGIFKAKLTQALNAKRYKEAGERFMGWVKPPEIRKRRKAEMNLFLSGNYDANGDSIPVYDALPDGRIRHRSTMRGADLRALMQRAGSRRNPRTIPRWRHLLNKGAYILS